MLLTSQKTPIIEKTEELCRTIVEQEAFKDLGRRVQAFQNNADATGQYDALVQQQNTLQEKQQDGEQLAEEEMNAFEASREALFSNPVAKDFLDAQQSIHKVVETVTQYVTKTFELGRVPEKDDFESGSCGPSCGCS